MPCNYKEYHDDWKSITLERKEAVGWKCELCPAEHKKPHWKTGSIVILTTYHIDGNIKNNSNANLLVCCQRCHLRLDREKHLKKRRKNLFKESQ